MDIDRALCDRMRAQAGTLGMVRSNTTHLRAFLRWGGQKHYLSPTRPSSSRPAASCPTLHWGARSPSSGRRTAASALVATVRLLSTSATRTLPRPLR